MEWDFYKYQGTGNDFVFLLDWDKTLPMAHSELAQKLCARRWSIGADGLLILHQHPEYTFEVLFYNPDGSPGFCGNGLRCTVHLALYLELIKERQIAPFLAADGVHNGVMVDKSNVIVQMKDVPKDFIKLHGGYFLNTGAPHFVKLVPDVQAVALEQEAQEINKLPPFHQARTNVNFAQFDTSTNTVTLRTYEKGVEAETLSCGTGATAAGLIAFAQGFQSPVIVQTPGGRLEVSCFEYSSTDGFKYITLGGLAEMVCHGTVTL